MKKLILLSLMTVSSLAFAEKTYQVTGPVLEVNDKTIVVQKGKDRWEIAKDPAVKTTGDVAVGSKVDRGIHHGCEEHRS